MEIVITRHINPKDEHNFIAVETSVSSIFYVMYPLFQEPW